ncbi:MAG: peroxiredoxin [Deinococcales bacterium]
MDEAVSTPDAALPRLNEPAPDFVANTTHGKRALADYAGRWLVLFSHPGDFTPVCTTEFLAFSSAFPEFQAAGVELLGLSVDSVHAHLAWVRNIEEHFGVEVPFPVIDDVSMRVARTYGMIQPGASGTAAVRAVFVIDPQGVLRAMLYYPLTTGRSVREILRLVQALQATDAHGIATPEGWEPGDKVMVPPPDTQEGAQARLEEGYECVDWYFCKRELPA